MSTRNDAMLSPVGAVWRSVRTTNPAIELYNPDESHPSVAGTYVAACSFYTVIFQNSPLTVSYTAGLPATEAAVIKNAAKLIVYDSLGKWKVGENDPTADFNFSVTTGTKKVTFSNSSLKAISYLWDFGDGTKDITATPVHTYVSPGSYTVTLVARLCNRTDTMKKMVTLGGTGIGELKDDTSPFPVYPNPFRHSVSLNLSSLQGNAEISVYNYLGINVFHKQVKAGLVTLDLNHLASGNYFLKVNNDQGQLSIQRLMKQ
jgi:hypothetical protein